MLADRSFRLPPCIPRIIAAELTAKSAPDGYTIMIASEMEKWAKVIKASGARVD